MRSSLTPTHSRIVFSTVRSSSTSACSWQTTQSCHWTCTDSMRKFHVKMDAQQQHVKIGGLNCANASNTLKLWIVSSGTYLNLSLFSTPVSCQLWDFCSSVSVCPCLYICKYVKNKSRNRIGEQYLNDCLITFVERVFFFCKLRRWHHMLSPVQTICTLIIDILWIFMFLYWSIFYNFEHIS